MFMFKDNKYSRGAKTTNLAFHTWNLVDWSDRFRGICCSSTFRRQGDGAVTGSQTTDDLPGKAAGAPAEAPTGAPATNKIQKMPVKLCKLITQSHGTSWPSLRDLSGIFTSCVFFMTFLCVLTNYLFVGIAVRCVWVGYRVDRRVIIS